MTCHGQRKQSHVRSAVTFNTRNEWMIRVGGMSDMPLSLAYRPDSNKNRWLQGFRGAILQIFPAYSDDLKQRDDLQWTWEPLLSVLWDWTADVDVRDGGRRKRWIFLTGTLLDGLHTPDLLESDACHPSLTGFEVTLRFLIEASIYSASWRTALSFPVSVVMSL